MSDRTRRIADTIANSLHLAAYLRVIGQRDDKVIVASRADARQRFTITVSENEEDFEDCA